MKACRHVSGAVLTQELMRLVSCLSGAYVVSRLIRSPRIMKRTNKRNKVPACFCKHSLGGVCVGGAGGAGEVYIFRGR